MSEELRARETIDGLEEIATIFDEGSVHFETIQGAIVLLSFASSAAGQREGMRDALNQAKYALSVLSDELEDGALKRYAVAEQAKVAAILASPSAPEERRDEVEDDRLILALAAAHDAQSGSPTKAVTSIQAGVDMCRTYWTNIADAARAALTPVPGER